MGLAHGHASVERSETSRPEPAALTVCAPLRGAPEREAEAPTTRNRMEAAFARSESAEWTTRERIARRAQADEPDPQPPKPELEETDAEPERSRPRLRLVEPIDDAPEASAPTQTVEPIARGPPLAAVVQTKLTVSSPGDPLEREADIVAARVLRAAPARSGPPRGDAPIRGPPHATQGLPRSVASVVVAPGGGRSLDAAVREQIEPHVGIDLGHVRVRQGPDAAAAAHDLHARAFTSGSTIFLAAGSSPADLGLMAHEATHVAQQQTVATARTTLMRDVTDVLPDISVDDVIPDWILDGVRETVRAIPGYIVLTYIAGRDPLSDEPAPASPQEVIEALLTRGPFGAAVGTVLASIDVLGDVFQLVMDGLTAHDLTLARVQRDIDSAWGELSVTNGIAGNVAIVERYVAAILRDVTAFVDSIVERVLEVVRAVVADVAEPLLETPAIAPLWNLVKKVLRYDPLRGVAVDAPTADIIADFLRLIGEEERLAQMQERGTLQATADWLDTQLGTFASLATELGTLFSEAREATQPQNLPDLLANLEALAWRAFGFIQGVGLFAATLILKVLELIKESLLGWLSENAHSLPGFHLLTVILGQNPFTGEEVPLTAETLIKGFITLLPGGEATYDQLAESGVIASAAERIEGEMGRLDITLELITGTFRGIWDTLTLDDLLAPLDAFARILAQFGEPLARLIAFVAVVIEVVVTLILRLMNFPSELLGSVIGNTLAAIEDIRRDPVAFLLNMVEAIKLGFTAFFDNIGQYLLDGLVAWLFRGLGQLGITLPADFSLASVLTLVFQVLGLTIEHLWEKLGEHIGPERVQMIRDALDALTGAWAFIQDVQREGLPAIWRYLKDQLSGIWTTLLGMATEWIMQVIVVSATVKLLSFIDPSGIMATINTCIAIFNAIMSAIEYMRDMLEVFNQYVMTLAAVAAGNIVPGAQMLELGLAAIIPIAIGFLAKQVGIGNIPEKIAELIGRLREIVDQAIDWLIEQALRLGAAALNALGLTKPSDTAAEVDPSDHVAVVSQVVTEMETQASAPDEYAALRAEKETQARAIEQRYAGALAPGIGLSIVFDPPAADAPDADLDFEVVIAPNASRKRGSTPTAPRTITFVPPDQLDVDGRRFKIDDPIQVKSGKEGGGWAKDVRFIKGFKTEVIGGASFLMIGYDTKPPTGVTWVLANNYPTEWRTPIAALAGQSAADLALHNAVGRTNVWPSWDIARWVMNHRAHGVQEINPKGKQWEHIAEQSTGGPDSADNLALADKDVNKDLGDYYGEVRAHPNVLLFEATMPAVFKLRDYMAGQSVTFQRDYKVRYVYPSSGFGVALRWEDLKRGEFQVLE